MRIRRTLVVLPCVWAFALAAAAASLVLGGCATTEAERQAARGELPEGYESWDQYFEERDALQREFDRGTDLMQHRQPRRGTVQR